MRAKRARIVKTLKEVAHHYGVTHATVTRSWRPEGMPGEPGIWRLDEIDDWRTLRDSKKDRTGTLGITGASVREPGSGPVSEGGIDSALDKASQAKLDSLVSDAKKKDAEARIKEIQAIKAENINLVEIEEVEEFISTFLAEARNILKSVPVKLKRFGVNVSEAADKELDLALHAIRKKSERIAELRSGK